MEQQRSPFIEQICKEIEKILDRHIEAEHQLLQKDIQIATLTLELGLQKKAYTILRQSHANFLKNRSNQTDS